MSHLWTSVALSCYCLPPGYHRYSRCLRSKANCSRCYTHNCFGSLWIRPGKRDILQPRAKCDDHSREQYNLPFSVLALLRIAQVVDCGFATSRYVLRKAMRPK